MRVELGQDVQYSRSGQGILMITAHRSAA
jgi:hypothetical protein